jgi:hypothetical protein
VRHDESSQNVNEIDVERIIQRSDGERGSNVTATDVDRAIREVIKLAVDAGDYERAAALLDVARRSTPKERA